MPQENYWGRVLGAIRSTEAMKDVTVEDLRGVLRDMGHSEKELSHVKGLRSFLDLVSLDFGGLLG